MFQIDMTATKRDVSGKGPMRQLRMKGITPGVVYGGGKEAEMLQFETKELHAKLLKCARRNAVVTLNIEGVGSKSVQVAEVQTHPVKETLIHVDFCEIDLDKERNYDVPVVYTGSSKGVALGGDLNVALTSLKVLGKPLHIPDQIEVDVTPLAIGDTVKCGEIALPAEVTLLMEAEEVAVSVDKV